MHLGVSISQRGNHKKMFWLTSTPLFTEQHQQHAMEDDRAQVDLGVAVDIEARLEEAAAQRQPKKRFVGRRAAEAASSSGSNGNVNHNGAIESK